MVLQKMLMLLVFAGVACVMVVRSMDKAASAAQVAPARAGRARWWSSLHLGWPEVSAATLLIILITERS